MEWIRERPEIWPVIDMDGTKMRSNDIEKNPFPPTRILLVILLCLALFLSLTPFITLNTQTEKTRAGSGLYHTYDEMVSEIQGIEINHSSIVKLHNLTTTFEGKTVWAIKVSDDPQINDSAEPDVLFTAGQKANSLISVEIALYLLNYLTNNYGNDSFVTELVNNREIWIIPMLNPDGHEYIGNGTEDWEKNKRDNVGVNLNTNYGSEWGLDDHSSDDTGSQYYHGEGPFSEIETRAIKGLVESQDFVLSLSFSSFGETITYPWGYTNSSTPDEYLLHEIASDMAMYSDYNLQQSGELYINHGNMDDWLYNNASVLPFTFLVGDENIPDETQIEDIVHKNIPSCLYLIDIADDPNRAFNAEWTFMVYMGADNNLEEDGIRDFNEMEMIGSNPYVNIVVQFDRAVGPDPPNANWDDTRRFLVMKDDDPDIINTPMLENIGEANMADSQVLLNFVNWSITNFPAKHYFLDLWGHGKGWLGVAEDKGLWLTMNGIKSVLPKFKDRIDAVGFDNCNMAMIEVYTQFLGYVDYIVGSEKEEDAWGWPYDRIFTELLADPQTSPLDLSTLIMTHYVDWAKNESFYSATVSVVDMNYLYEVINRTDALARELNWTLALYADEIGEARNGTERYAKKPLPRDLYHFAELIIENVPNRPIQIAAENLMTSIETMIVAEEHWTSELDSVPVDNAHGITVWLYDGTASDFLKYQDLDFAELTFWDEFLATYKASPLKPQVNLSVNHSFLDSDGEGNEDTIQILYTSNFTGLDIITEVYNNENQHINTFYNNGTIQGIENTSSFNPYDYGYPSDYYNFYIYLVNDANELQNYSEIIEGWLGNEKPDGAVVNVTFYRVDGTPVGGDTGKKPIDGEDTLIKAVIANSG
ncbi:MAG: M14 family zinc carboxypeptidase, partial [Thermoplasmata archaeon]